LLGWVDPTEMPGASADEAETEDEEAEA
jgi:hypothetical protein